MAVYQVRLLNQALNLDQIIIVPEDQYILDMAERKLGLDCLQVVEKELVLLVLLK